MPNVKCQSVYLFLIGFFCFLNSSFGSQPVVTFRGDDWCPYTCDPSTGRLGYMIDLAKAILEPEYKVDFQILSWERAKKEVSKGVYDGFVGAIGMEGSDFVFNKETFGQSMSRFFSLKSSKFDYKNIKSLNGFRIAVGNGYQYGQQADRLIKNQHPSFVIISGDDVQAKMLQLLKKKRIDAFYEDPVVVQFLVQTNKDFRQIPIKKSGYMDDQNLDVLFGFSKNNKRATVLIQKIDEGLKKFKESGRLNQILSKYGLKVWSSSMDLNAEKDSLGEPIVIPSKIENPER